MGRAIGRCLRRRLPPWILLLLPALLGGCIEDRLNVEITTRILPDGTALRKTEYRLVRVDTEKDDLPLPLPPATDTLRLLHRFPRGEAWTVRDQLEEKAHIVTTEATLGSPNDLDWDYWRGAAPGSPLVARNRVSFAMRGEGPGATYEYLETLVDPASPLAAARRLVELLARHEKEFVEALEGSLAKAAPRSPEIRRLYRDHVLAPASAAITRLVDRPFFVPRERQELDKLADKASTEALVSSLASVFPGASRSEVEDAAEKALGDLAERIVDQLKREGLPVPDEARGDEAIPRIHFRVTLVMPAPINRANTCVQGDTATWEFDRDDLYGRGFEMWARAAFEDPPVNSERQRGEDAEPRRARVHV